MNNNPLQRRMFAQQLMNRHNMANEPMGILASSPQLMNAAQGLANGGMVKGYDRGGFNPNSLDLYTGSNLELDGPEFRGQSGFGAKRVALEKEKKEREKNRLKNLYSSQDVGGGETDSKGNPTGFEPIVTSDDLVNQSITGTPDLITELEKEALLDKKRKKETINKPFVGEVSQGSTTAEEINKSNKKANEVETKKEKNEPPLLLKPTKTTVEGNLNDAKSRLNAIKAVINNPNAEENIKAVDAYKNVLIEAQTELNKTNKELTLEEVDRLARPLAGLEDNASYDDDRHTAFWMALIKGGLATAGGESSNALTNIAKGLNIGVDAYGKDMSKLNEQEREDRKALGKARYTIITDKKNADVALRSAKVQFLQTKAALIQTGDQYQEGMEFKKEVEANKNSFNAANLEIAIFQTMNDTKIKGETLDLQKERLYSDNDYRQKTLDNAIKTLESNERISLLGKNAKELLGLGTEYADFKDGKYTVTPKGRDLLEIFLINENSSKITDTMEAIKNARTGPPYEVGGVRFKTASQAEKAAFLYYKTISPLMFRQKDDVLGGTSVAKSQAILKKFAESQNGVIITGGKTEAPDISAHTEANKNAKEKGQKSYTIGDDTFKVQ